MLGANRVGMLPGPAHNGGEHRGGSAANQARVGRGQVVCDVSYGIPRLAPGASGCQIAFRPGRASAAPLAGMPFCPGWRRPAGTPFQYPGSMILCRASGRLSGHCPRLDVTAFASVRRGDYLTPRGRCTSGHSPGWPEHFRAVRGMKPSAADFHANVSSVSSCDCERDAGGDRGGTAS